MLWPHDVLVSPLVNVVMHLLSWFCSALYFFLPKASVYNNIYAIPSPSIKNLFVPLETWVPQVLLSSSSSFIDSCPQVLVCQDQNKWRPNRTWSTPLASCDCGPTEAGKCGVTDKTAGQPHRFSTLLHHLFKVQDSVSCWWTEACLQMVTEHNPWFPDKGSFDLEIWNQVKQNVEWAARWGKIFQ